MYRVCLKRRFASRHALVGADFGPEGTEHGHDYILEWRLAAPALDRLGFVVDIDAAGAVLDAVLARYKGVFLNEAPALAGVNPSLERFAKALFDELEAALAGAATTASRVHCEGLRLWESEEAWAEWTAEGGE